MDNSTLQALDLDLKTLQETHSNGLPSSSNAGRAADLFASALKVGQERTRIENYPRQYRLQHADDLEQSEDFLCDLQINAFTWAVKFTSESHEYLVLRLLWLADTVLFRYEKYKSPSDLELATSTIERVSPIIKESHDLFVGFLFIFAKACLARFESTEAHDVSELDKAIIKLKIFQSVVESDSELLQLYASILLQRFRKTDSPDDLKEGIEKSELVIKHRNVSTPTKRYAFSNLAECYPYLYDFQPIGGKKYLDLAVDNGVKAAELVSEGGETADTAFVFGALAKGFFDRYKFGRRKNDIEKAIENGKKAIRLSKPEAPDKARWMDNLGLAYDVKFEDTGDISDLQEAIVLLEMAVELSPRNTPIAQRSNNNLANALCHRFEWTGETESLDLAISKLECLVETGNWTDIERASCLQNLASALFQRYRRYLKYEDLNKAVERLTEALDKYPEGHADIPSAASLLCSILASRYETLQRAEDILEAVRHGRSSISLRAPGDPYIATYFGNLAQAYKIKWAKSHVDEDLDVAINYSHECIRMTPLDAQNRAYQLFNHVLANCTTVTHHNLDEPLRLFKEATDLPNGVPLVRITAARNAIRILGELGRWEDAKSLGLTAMGLLPLVCGRYLALEDQQQAVLQTSGLAADVCSLLLQMDDLENALLQLEAGRAVLLGYVMDDHDDLVALKGHRPNGIVLAQKFEELRGKLRIPPELRGSSLGEAKLRNRRAAELAVNECLLGIRQLEGHKDFLRGLSVEEMKACSTEGPVVIVNVTYIRSDAILIVGSRIRVVQLPNLQLKKAAEFSFGSYVRDSPWKRDAEVVWNDVPKEPTGEPFVEWLWHSCVKVVLEELKASDASAQSGDLPRVWWIGSGAATGFPFHAATSGFRTDQEDTLSLTIPSYAPSIKALLHSRKRSHRYQGQNQKPRLTVVTMTTTPGHKSLVGVSREKEAIIEVCKEDYSCVDLPQPTVNAVLKTMVDSDIIHFACHGIANIEDPSQSHLLLEQVTENGKEVDKLTVSRMLSLAGVQRAWIAYLSACSTASIRASRLADEGLHTSGALQIAGFAHVIGSLWPVDDEVCADVARVFYEHLIKPQAQFEQNKTVAAALRAAVLHIRQRDPSSWRKWGAYIHSGA